MQMTNERTNEQETTEKANLHVWSKEALLVFFKNTHTFVLHTKGDFMWPGRIQVAYTDLNLAVPVRELDSVAHEVGQHMLQAKAVRQDARRNSFVHQHNEIDVLGGDVAFHAHLDGLNNCLHVSLLILQIQFPFFDLLY